MGSDISTSSKSIPTGDLPYPSWYYNPIFSPYVNDVSRPRLKARSHRVPGVVQSNPGNTVGNSRNFDYPNKSWYLDKYHERKTNALRTNSDPRNYLTGEPFPYAMRGVQVFDIGTGDMILSTNPKNVRKFKLTDHNYYKPPPVEKRPTGIPYRVPY